MFANVTTFDSLKNSSFRYYFLGMVGQWGAMNMQMVTRSLLIYRLTGSAAILGLMSLATAVPMLVLPLFGGAIADRLPKKRVLQLGQGASAVIALSVAIALSTGYLSSENAGSWWILIANSALQGIVMALMLPSRQAIIPEIVSTPQIMNAVALNALGNNSLRILAPAAAGYLIHSLGFEAIFYVMTGLYVMATILTGFIRTTRTIELGGRNALCDIRDGLKYIRHSANILLVTLFAMGVIVLAMPHYALMPIFADDILKVAERGLGLLFTASGVGAIVSSLALASLPSRKRGAILLYSGLILGVALGGFAFSRSMPLSLAAMVLVGVGLTTLGTMMTVLLQSYAEAEYRGRVMSITMVDVGLSQLVAFFAALLAEGIGAQWSVGGLAMILMALSVGALALVPRLRRLE